MLTYAQFSILNARRDGPVATQRKIAKASGISLGSVNAAAKELLEAGLLDEGGAVTERGMKALRPYKVDNAVIMAAGLSSRFAPISYEKPKGVLTVKGEVLIERQIRQLKEAGIDDITVVVGYKKEEFFYLADEFGVDIVVNPDYARRNNNSTIKRVEDRLGNTYVCSSDDYFTENPFEPYVYESYYSAVYAEGPTEEWCLKTRGKDDVICGVTVGGENSWVMLGHTYWDRAFSRTFCEILNDEYDRPETADKLWEAIYAEHLDRLRMVMRKYPAGVIWEFDNLDELSDFDPDFIENVDSEILDNICSVLKCRRSDVRRIVPIKKGMTNLSFRFEVGGRPYVYRHPGPGSDKITNRRAETFCERVASEAGIDRTFVYEDPDEGWKISRFLENRRDLDYHNPEDVEHAMGLLRRLHSIDADCGYDFDLHEGALDIIGMLGERHKASFRDFGELLDLANRMDMLAKAHGARRVLSHNDFYYPNFLISEDGDMQLIDWEYAGMSDYASDLGVFVVCCEDYTVEDAERIYALYFGREPEPEERLHCLAYACVVAFYWFVWALYQDAYSEPVGEFLYIWYRHTKRFGAAAEELARKLGYEA